MRHLKKVVVAIVVTLALFGGLFLWPLRDPHPAARAVHNALAIRDVEVYPSPDVAPIEHATVIVRDGRIAAVGAGVVIPADAKILDCGGCVVTAGFWNAHVHFTESKWRGSAWKSAATLDAQLRDMFTSRGFTTVVDLGSDIRDPVSLRRRIASGDLVGPAIYTAGSGIFPPHGIPYYLSDLPAFIRWLIPQPETPDAAVRVVKRNIGSGADVVKLFTGSIVKRGTVLPMPLEIARAAVEEGHAAHQLAFAHPSDLAGTTVARDAGVDVLAHAPSFSKGVDSAFIKTLVDHHMTMIPTLKMFGTTVTKDSAFLAPIYREVRWFHELGGRFVFGTDVGYMTDYSTDDEFVALAASGLSAMDVLRMLTTAPADLFGVARERGTVEIGKAADLVVLAGDPAKDIAAFARVVATIRQGEVQYIDARAIPAAAARTGTARSN